MCCFHGSILLFTVAEMTKSELECVCEPPCEEVRYEPQMSYAQLSKFNIDRLILGNPVKQKRLEESHLQVLSIYYCLLCRPINISMMIRVNS